MSHLALQDAPNENGIHMTATSMILPDSMTDKCSESEEISSSTPESSQSESSIEDAPPSYEGLPSSSKRHGPQDCLTMAAHTSSSNSPSIPRSNTDTLTSSLPKHPYLTSSSKMAHEDLGKTSAMISGKTEEVKRAGGGVSSCYGNEEVRRSSASFISSVLLPATDSKQLQGMEGMSLSSYVKLMNLDVQSGLTLNLQEPNSISGLRSSGHQLYPNHSLPGGGGTSQNTAGHMISGAGHMIAGVNPMMGGRGAVKSAVGDYHSPPRASLSMAQASALLLPSPNQTGILAIQDSRPTLVDMVPPSFSPGLPGGLNSAGGGASLNFFPPQAAASSSTSPRQQQGPQTSSSHGRRLGKRSHDLLSTDRNSMNSTQEFSPNVIRDSSFPPDSGCGGSDSSTSKVLPDIKPPLGFNFSAAGGPGIEGGLSGVSQHLKWQAHMVNTWMDLCDGALQDIPQVGFQVDTDKGFNYSIWDDSFVCQKKNHFQVTVTVTFPAVPKFVKMKSGSLKPITRFRIHLHGVKFEQINSEIKLEQSRSDRSKTKFEPEIIEIPADHENGEQIKRTLCRLHFSETTHNNMRKRGKPNPDQKYFSLVVALYADTEEDSYPVVAHVSERIIVRASNPGNFENDCDVTWFKSSNPEHIYHQGRVGINTDKPEEALSVHGNIQVTGQILQASDIRIKRNIKKVQTKPHQHLNNISQLQLYEYQLAPLQQSDKTTSSISIKEQTPRDALGDRTEEEASGSAKDHSQGNSSHGYHARGAMNETSLIKDLGNAITEEEDSCLRKYRRDEGAQAPHESNSGRKIVGLLAQEVREVLPEAVMETSQTVKLADGSGVKRLLVVDKDQVLMEVIGAVQELKEAMNEQKTRLLKSGERSLTEAKTTPLGLHVAVHKEPSLLRSELHLSLKLQTSILHCLIFLCSFLIFSFIICFILL